MNLQELHYYLQSTLLFNNFVDTGINGVQVENTAPIHQICFSVDSNLESIHNAVENQADILIVHHGLYWGQTEILTDIHYQKIKLLIENNIALYAIHLPLDAHHILGNNVQIAKLLYLENLKQSFTIKNQPLGFIGSINILQLISLLEQEFPYTFSNSWKKILQNLEKMEVTVGISSGSLSSSLLLENKHKCDIIITGETSLPTYNLALDYGIIIIPLGHYFTEIYGLQALAKEVTQNYPKIITKFLANEKLI